MMISDAEKNSVGHMAIDKGNMKSGEKVVRRSNKIANKPAHYRDLGVYVCKRGRVK